MRGLSAINQFCFCNEQRVFDCCFKALETTKMRESQRKNYVVKEAHYGRDGAWSGTDAICRISLG